MTPTDAELAEKNERNARVQSRYDELRQEGKHGHYETMFRVVREEVEHALAASRLSSREQRPSPSPHHAPGMKVGPALVFEHGSLHVKQQGYGDEDGNGEFVFVLGDALELIEEEGKDILVVPVNRSDLLFLRDHLNKLFPLSSRGEISEGEVAAGAEVIAASSGIDAPKLPAACWMGLSRAILTAARAALEAAQAGKE